MLINTSIEIKMKPYEKGLALKGGKKKKQRERTNKRILSTEQWGMSVKLEDIKRTSNTEDIKEKSNNNLP